MHTLETQITIKADRQQVWNFFSDPRNLPKITPPELALNILRVPAGGTFAGAIFEYEVRAIGALKVRWVSEITHCCAGEYFVDEQRFGPYAFWHHLHRFSEVPGGTLMVDLVHYELPFRVFSEPIRHWYVTPTLNHIFQFRKQALATFFEIIECPNSVSA